MGRKEFAIAALVGHAEKATPTLPPISFSRIQNAKRVLLEGVKDEVGLIKEDGDVYSSRWETVLYLIKDAALICLLTSGDELAVVEVMRSV